MEMTVVNGRDHLGLGLGLSLGIAGTTSSVAAPQRALTSAGPTPGQKNKTSSACHEMPLFLRGIDVNREPAAEHEDEEPGASSPDSTLSTLSCKRGRRAAGAGGREQERACSDDEDSGFGSGAGGSRKKLRLSKDQSAVLEDSFNQHSTLNPKQKAALARQLGLRPRQVEVWFQNRRARTKLKQTEVDCEALRRRCDALTEENRRLLREVQALKLPMPHPQLYMRAPPLTMCPSCERVASSAKPAAVAENRAVLGSGPWGPGPVRPVFVDRPAQRA